jgi:hypothetical protein
VCKRARPEHSPGPWPAKHSSITILAGGATGTLMGANRSTPPTLAPIGGMPAPGAFQGRRDDLAACVRGPRGGWSSFCRTLAQRSVRTVASAREAGLARNDGELIPIRLGRPPLGVLNFQ